MSRSVKVALPRLLVNEPATFQEVKLVEPRTVYVPGGPFSMILTLPRTGWAVGNRFAASGYLRTETPWFCSELTIAARFVAANGSEMTKVTNGLPSTKREVSRVMSGARVRLVS